MIVDCFWLSIGGDVLGFVIDRIGMVLICDWGDVCGRSGVYKGVWCVGEKDGNNWFCLGIDGGFLLLVGVILLILSCIVCWCLWVVV